MGSSDIVGNKALQNGLAASRGLSVKVVAYRGIVGNVSFFSHVSWLSFLNPRISTDDRGRRATSGRFVCARGRAHSLGGGSPLHAATLVSQA
jgi:hypothetical protein